jgi:hypothetical protein
MSHLHLHQVQVLRGGEIRRGNLMFDSEIASLLRSSQ